MNVIEFDEAWTGLVDDERCEKVNEAMFGLIRAAFTAGWKAAMESDIGRIMNIEKR